MKYLLSILLYNRCLVEINTNLIKYDNKYVSIFNKNNKYIFDKMIDEIFYNKIIQNKEESDEII